MTRKLHRSGDVRVPINPVVTEGPAPRDPANVRIMLREIHRLEARLGQGKGDITTLRQLLLSHSVDEHWEVPG